jgi:fermentation-respiration switch protein FrsA (DUF1100 family)
MVTFVATFPAPPKKMGTKQWTVKVFLECFGAEIKEPSFQSTLKAVLYTSLDFVLPCKDILNGNSEYTSHKVWNIWYSKISA